MDFATKRFLKQFIAKKSHDPVQVDQDIMGITGATVSSWAMASGVKKALIMTEELVQEVLANPLDLSSTSSLE